MTNVHDNPARFVARWVALILMMVAVGCGSDDVASADEENSGDNVRFEQPGPTANNSDGPCDGCVDDDDACQDGDTVEACGEGGAACTACVGDEQCVDGECMAPMTEACGPDNCDGCCTAQGNCVNGGGDDACGVGGGACVACDGGNMCNAGVCMGDNPPPDPCGPANCAGCCDAAGMCVGGSAATACGMGGGQCADCSANGEGCNAGLCEAPQPSCATTCAGCCVGDVCITATSDAQCGSGGAACMACGANEMCAAGACMTNPPSDRWQIVMVSASIPSTKLNGSSWDPFGGYPDVVTGIATEDTVLGESWLDYTSVAYDQLFPVWDEVVIPDATEQALSEGVAFYLFDDELDVDDICLQVEVVDPFTIAPGQNILTTCYDDPWVEWTWRLERAP